MLPQEIFTKEHSETLFPAYQFARQCWSSLKFSLKSKISNENGQVVEMEEGGWRQQIFQLFIIKLRSAYCGVKS